MRFIASIVVIALALLAAGCGGEQKKWVGTYQGKLRATKLNAPDGTNPKERTATLTLNSNGSYDQDLGQLRSEGKWKVEGTALTLTPSKVSIDGTEIPTKLSKVMYNPVTFTLESDNKITLVREGEEHVYTRQ